jgi:hypothetical protein
MGVVNRIATAMRSVIPRPTTTRKLLRERRLVAAVLRPGSGVGLRRIDEEAEVGPLAEALRDAARIGDVATLYFESPALAMTLRFEGGATRSILVGRPADRLKSTAFLAEIDGAVYVATGRQLSFLFASPDQAQAAEASSGTIRAASDSEPAFSPAAQRAAGAWPWTSAASEA